MSTASGSSMRSMVEAASLVWHEYFRADQLAIQSGALSLQILLFVMDPNALFEYRNP